MQKSQYNAAPARLVLVTAGGGITPRTQEVSSTLIELVSVGAPRCSAFLAEAAVLVLVLALLDRYLAKGGLEMTWIVGAFALSGFLLAASVATEFVARRWLKAH